jgi:hypothetical protein
MKQTAQPLNSNGQKFIAKEERGESQKLFNALPDLRVNTVSSVATNMLVSNVKSFDRAFNITGRRVRTHGRRCNFR